MVRKKTKSHRQSLSVKYLIDKKAKAQRKKMKKLGTATTTHKKMKKDPGIPNLWPFKEQLIRETIQKREKSEEDDANKRDEKARRVEKRRNLLLTQKLEHGDSMDQSTMVEDAVSNQRHANGAPVRRSYFRELKQVLEAADVIIEVLDARDPLGCRCLEMEQRIVGELSAKSGRPKRIILLLNKIDLVPRENVEAWLKYLRRDFPAIAFKASTQSQKHNISSGARGKATSASDEQVSSSNCLGGDALLQLLKNYSRSLDMKTSITVGVIGFPNVGKSSLINSLKRTRAVAAGSTPGLTKTVQEIRLDKKIKLLDSPGVVFNRDESSSKLALRNATRIEQLDDPVGVVHDLVAKYPKVDLLQAFSIADFTSPDEFLLRVAHKRGKLKKGGIADIESAARLVLNDWNEGKIPFYTKPPVISSHDNEDESMKARIVDSWGEEFNIASLLDSSNSATIASYQPTVIAPVAMESTLTIVDSELQFFGASSEDAMEM